MNSAFTTAVVGAALAQELEARFQGGPAAGFRFPVDPLDPLVDLTEQRLIPCLPLKPPLHTITSSLAASDVPVGGSSPAEGSLSMTASRARVKGGGHVKIRLRRRRLDPAGGVSRRAGLLDLNLAQPMLAGSN